MPWPFSLPVTIYLGAILLIAAGAVVWLQVYLRLARRFQERRLRSKERLQPLPTSSPLDDPNAVARKRGIESIRAHFSVTRRVAIPLVIGLAALAAGIPFVSHLPAAFLSLLAAAVTVLLGIAARPAVENAIAGLVISNSKLINIGDTIRVDGNYGTVEDVTTTHTTVKLWDWRRFVVPNREMLQSRFINYSLFDRFVWSHAEIWVSPETDLDRLRELAIEATRESEHFAPHEEPQMWVMGADKDAIKVWVAGWADTPAAAWMLAADIREGLLRRMHEHGMATQGFRIIDHSPSPPA